MYQVPYTPFSSAYSKFIRSNMDRIRRSLRDSFRKRSNSGSPSERHVAGGNGAGAGDLSKPQLWSQDEATVRAGTCAFSVKVSDPSDAVLLYTFPSASMTQSSQNLTIRHVHHSSSKHSFFLRNSNSDGLKIFWVILVLWSCAAAEISKNRFFF